MRRGKTSVLVAGVATAALVLAVVPAAAQQYEEFPGPDEGAPLQGYTRSDGTIVLTDQAFCSFLLGSLWEGERLTFSDLIDRSKKQKPAKAAAFVPGSDEATLGRCAQIVSAFRTEAPEADALLAWARRSPVVPEALAGLLPEDFFAEPLAVAAPVLEAARTSGFGSVVSAPFAVDGETWLVEVAAVECSTWSGSLRNARDAAGIIEVADNREYLYNVVPGHYYWDVTAPDCDWSVDLAAVEIGPDPNATPLPKVAVPKLFGENWSRVHGQTNAEYLTAAQARQALLDVGLTVGVCTDEAIQFVSPGRVWGQVPAPGTLLESGSPVDVFIDSDCDVVLGDRIILE